MSSSEEETSCVKGSAFKAHMKDKKKQEKAFRANLLSVRVGLFPLILSFVEMKSEIWLNKKLITIYSQ